MEKCNFEIQGNKDIRRSTFDCSITSFQTFSYPSWMERQLFDIHLIELGRLLGSGQYGYVYKATVSHGNARWPVALKRIKVGEGRRGQPKKLGLPGNADL